jgi:hypothetical protein
MEALVAGGERLGDQTRDLGLAKVQRPLSSSVEEPVGRHEYPAAAQLRLGEHAVRGKAVAEPEGHKEGLANGIPVRETALVTIHVC